MPKHFDSWWQLITSGATPRYGLDLNVAQPPLSLAISVLLIFGVEYLGRLLLNRCASQPSSLPIWLKAQGITVGAAALAALLFPIALIGELQRDRAVTIALSLMVIGLFRAITLARLSLNLLQTSEQRSALINRAQRTPMLVWLTLLIAGGLGLLSLGPITDADSLDYHLGVAIAVLNSGAFPFAPEWFHSRLAGAGEILIALGLAVGAEQFGAMLQCSAVLGLLAMLWWGVNPQSALRPLVALALVTSPVFLGWVSSPKPMLLPGAMTTLALLIGTHAIWNRSNTQALPIKSSFSLICLLVMMAAMMKFNFLLSGGLVGAFALLGMVKRGQTLAALSIGLVCTALFFAPYPIWKHVYFGGDWLSTLTTPMPGHWPGTSKFEEFLRGFRDSYFPLSLLVPPSLGYLSTVLGVGALLALSGLGGLGAFLSLAKKSLVKNDALANHFFVVIALITATLGLLLGQLNARFFLEPYYWLLFALLVWSPRLPAMLRKTLMILVSTQALAVLTMNSIGLALLSVGAISVEQRKEVLLQRGYDYSAAIWLDEVAPTNAVVLSGLRSVALMPRLTISTDSRSYLIAEGLHEHAYFPMLRTKRPTHLLVQSDTNAPAPTRQCFTEIAAGPKRLRTATRNPFHSGGEFDVWLLKADDSCLNRLLESEQPRPRDRVQREGLYSVPVLPQSNLGDRQNARTWGYHPTSPHVQLAFHSQAG